MKCPFCGKELVPVSMGDDDTVLYASICLPTENCICNTIASKKIWQALIQSQRDLQIAVGTLRSIGACNNRVSNRALQKMAYNALAQITHDNKE